MTLADLPIRAKFYWKDSEFGDILTKVSGSNDILAVYSDPAGEHCTAWAKLEVIPVKHKPIPKDWPVQPLHYPWPFLSTCANCGLAWDDTNVTVLTPSEGRCPFEYFHIINEGETMLADVGLTVTNDGPIVVLKAINPAKEVRKKQEIIRTKIKELEAEIAELRKQI